MLGILPLEITVKTENHLVTPAPIWWLALVPLQICATEVDYNGTGTLNTDDPFVIIIPVGWCSLIRHVDKG